VAAIADHLGFLSEDTRTVLRAAALLGVEFPVGDLSIVLDRRIRDLVTAIDEARTAGVLRDAGDRLAFRHPLIWQSMYDAIAAPLRQAWHREAARALVEAGVPDQRIARQLRLTMDERLDQTLLDWVTRAAPTLVAQAPQVATELLRRAVAQVPPSTEQGATLASHLADALYRTGECGDAVRIATRAIAEVTDADVLLDLHWTAAQCRAVLGRTDESLQVLEQAGLAEMTLRQRARLLVLTARAHRGLGEVSVAGDVAAQALAAAEEADDTWAIGWSLHVLIVVLLMRGEVSSVLPLFERALEVVGDDPAHTDLDLLLRINKAVALGDLDRYEEALDVAGNVREHADNVGSLVRLAQAQSALGQLLFEVGQWDDAQVEVATLPDDVKDPASTCCDRGIAAVIAFHRGDHVAARRHLHLVAPSTEQIGNRVVSSLTMAQSLDHEVADQPHKALAVLTARVGAEEMDEVEDLLPEVARLAAQTDHATAGAEVAERASELAQRSAVPHRLGTDAYCRGLLTRDPGLLEEAADRFRDAGRPLYRAKALEAAAVEFAARNDRDAARAAFTRADELYGWLRAEWDLGHLRAQLRQFGIRRGARARHRSQQTGWQALTPTERKVAALVAEGLSNRLIAERLVLSTRTIDTHVSHILAKLGVRSRLEIAREVTAQR
jgi:DNA-binding CsgD family transcriptional regulator/tetratricopeptide (TPR) repeat protein